MIGQNQRFAIVLGILGSCLHPGQALDPNVVTAGERIPLF
jgi:hypothetical protein